MTQKLPGMTKNDRFLSDDPRTALTIPAEHPPCDLGLQQNPGEPFESEQYEQKPLQPFLRPHFSQQFSCFSMTMYPPLSLNFAVLSPGPASL